MRLSILFLIATASSPPQDASQVWQESLNQGVAAYKAAKYEEAVEAFQRAVDLSPNEVTPHLYLATAFMSQYIPGSEAPANLDLARRAEAEFLLVLRLDPTNKTATVSLASLIYQQAQGMRDLDQKLRKLDEAASWFLKTVDLDPQNKVAYYSLGVIDWVRWYSVWLQARADQGMKPADPGPIPITALREQLKAQYLPVIERGISNLEKALAIDPQYDDAMAYMNLFVRERADLRDTAEEYRHDVELAHQWVEKTLQSKRLKSAEASPIDSQAVPPQRIRVGGNVQQANLIQKINPVYPPLAKQARIQGSVRFTVIIGRSGPVQNVQLVSGHPLLVEAAKQAVQQWIYKPTLLNGQPVEVISTVDVNFTLQP